MSLGKTLYHNMKTLFFPGLDLHTRSRYKFLPRFFESGDLYTLDAGCGNGALSYAAYKKGNRVLGVNYNEEQVQRNETFFSKLGIGRDQLNFIACNLYDLPSLDQTFDQIICSETLEHIKQDNLVIEHFYKCLKPGGTLHLCCPNALNREHNLGRVDGPEDGGHVRDGYTLESYKALLEPVGFKIVESVGVGSPLIQKLDRRVRKLRIHNDFVAMPLFLLLAPLQLLDKLNPEEPYSIYVRVIKPE